MDYSMSYQCLHFEEYGRRHLIHTYNPTDLLLLMRMRFGNDVYMVIIQYCLTMMAIGSCSITSSRPKNKRLFLSSCENSHKTSFFACSLGVSRSGRSSRSGYPSGRPGTIRIWALIECWCYICCAQSWNMISFKTVRGSFKTGPSFKTNTTHFNFGFFR